MKFDLSYATHEARKCADYLSQVCVSTTGETVCVCKCEGDLVLFCGVVLSVGSLSYTFFSCLPGAVMQ